MLTKRIIPCLDIDAGRVVKGVSFVDIRDAGDPAELAAFYDREGADELVFLDITASSDARDIMVHVVEQVSEQLFIPLTVGGGMRKVADIRRMLEAGVKMTAGSDSPWGDYAPGEFVNEVLMLAGAGMPVADAMASGMSGAADSLGMGEVAGRPAPGRGAGVPVVRGRPARRPPAPVACGGGEESEERGEISHGLGGSSGQFSVAISARLLSLSLPRLDALSDLLEVTASDPIGGTRAGSGDHG